MDQERPRTYSNKNLTKLRHQEHNYTNPPVSEKSAPKGDTGGDTDVGDNHKVKNSGFSRLSSFSQSKPESSQKESTQQSSSTSSSTDKQTTETKNKVTKKDVFNRIRRSEEELKNAAEMVRGGMTFQTASDTFNIPISTIRFYMARRGILPQRRRGRGSTGVRDDDLIHPPFEIIHYRLPDIDKPL